MKFSFPSQDTAAITEKIMKELGDRELGKMVSFETTSQGLNVVIEYMGKSQLEFQRSDEGDQSVFELTKEKIAFTHKAFKGQVTEKLQKVIAKAGGSVS